MWKNTLSRFSKLFHLVTLLLLDAEIFKLFERIKRTLLYIKVIEFIMWQ